MSWILTNCDPDCTGRRTYEVGTDLSTLNGLVINGIVLTGLTIDPASCWSISPGEDDVFSTVELLSYNTFYSDCATCQPVPCEPCDFQLRVNKDCTNYGADYSDDYSEDYFI